MECPVHTNHAGSCCAVYMWLEAIAVSSRPVIFVFLIRMLVRHYRRALPQSSGDVIGARTSILQVSLVIHRLVTVLFLIYHIAFTCLSMVRESRTFFTSCTQTWGGYILYLDTLYLDTVSNLTEMYLDTFVNFSNITVTYQIHCKSIWISDTF